MLADRSKYVDALLKVRNSGKLRNSKFLEMLQAQYAMPRHTITATKLAEAVGFKNYSAANLQYGLLGHAVSDALGLAPPNHENSNAPMWFWTLSTGNRPSSETLDQHFEFVMRPELVAALEAMKWVK